MVIPRLSPDHKHLTHSPEDPDGRAREVSASPFPSHL